MPTRVRTPILFNRDLKRLARKYPKVVDTVEALIADLRNDHRPGDQIPNVGMMFTKSAWKTCPRTGEKAAGSARCIMSNWQTLLFY